MQHSKSVEKSITDQGLICQRFIHSYRAWNSSRPLAIFRPIFSIWPSKSNLLGQIYCTFPMGKPLIVYCIAMFMLLRNGWPISNCYFKLWAKTYVHKHICTLPGIDGCLKLSDCWVITIKSLPMHRNREFSKLIKTLSVTTNLTHKIQLRS